MFNLDIFHLVDKHGLVSIFRVNIVIWVLQLYLNAVTNILNRKTSSNKNELVKAGLVSQEN